MPGLPDQDPETEDDEGSDDDADFDANDNDHIFQDDFRRPQPQGQFPMLYDGSRCSVRGFVGKLQYFIAKHVLSDIAVSDLLDLFQVALPRPNRSPGSVYKLAKVTKELFGSPRLEFDRLCSDCCKFLDQNNKCKERGCVSFNNPQQASYGYGKIGLRWQLKRILNCK